MDQENKPKSISPQEVLMGAFVYFGFGTQKLSLESMVTIALTANCPNSNIAQGVLAGMVEEGVLTWEKDKQGTVWFSPATPKEGEVK